MTLPVKKIYIDSRFKTTDSNSNSNFKFQLARNIMMPKNCVFYIEDVVIPHTWYTVEAGINDKLYVRYKLNVTEGDTYPNSNVFDNGVISFPSFVGWTDRALTIPSRNYTGSSLATQIQALLNGMADGYFLASYNTNTNEISIMSKTANASFQILTDRDLASGLNGSWNLPIYPNGATNSTYDSGSNYDRTNPASCNEVLRNSDGFSPVYSLIPYNPFISGFLDLRPIRNVYISSPNLGSFTTLGSRGESNIVKKVPVTSDYGYLIVDSFTSSHDFLNCSNQTLSTIEFNLEDVKGNFIPLHGANVSFSVVFSTYSEDNS